MKIPALTRALTHWSLRLGKLTPHFQQIPSLPSAARAVEGIGHGVQNGGLARPRHAADEEQPRLAQSGKVDFLGLPVGAKALHDVRFVFWAEAVSYAVFAS